MCRLIVAGFFMLWCLQASDTCMECFCFYSIISIKHKHTGPWSDYNPKQMETLNTDVLSKSREFPSGK